MTHDRKDYLQAAVAGASPVGLVILLYERFIGDLTRALAAMDRGDIETRVAEINHAFLILGQLEGSLEYDKAPEAARKQALFYNVVRGKILEGQLKSDRKLIEEQIALFNDVRAAWEQVDLVRNANVTVAPIPPPIAVVDQEQEGKSLLNASV
jgi:flagellar secretion chaperone FliS